MLILPPFQRQGHGGKPFNYKLNCAFVTNSGINNRVEALVGSHPKCEELVVAFGRCSLTRVELQEIFNKEKSRCIYFLERLYCMQFLGYNKHEYMLFLKVSSYSE